MLIAADPKGTESIQMANWGPGDQLWLHFFIQRLKHIYVQADVQIKLYSAPGPVYDLSRVYPTTPSLKPGNLIFD